MPRVLVDALCTSDKCQAIYKDMWCSREEQAQLHKGKSPCPKCGAPLKNIIGTPQFDIRGGGVYDPGRH